MNKLLSLLLILGLILLTGCSTKTNNITKLKVEKPNFDKVSYPKIDGSTATIPLSEAVASELLKLSKEDAKNFIKHNTTHYAYVNLIDGKADVIFVTEPSVEELKLAKDSNIELEVIPIVKEAFVFLVNVENPINSLTSIQVKDIYQGKTTNWKQVGGKDCEIIPYQREANSGSQTLMQQIVMKDLPLMKAPTKLVVAGMGALIESVAKYENSEKALGYSVYYYAKSMYNRDTIKLLSIDGIVPNNKTISAGEYPFTSAYYAVIKKSSPKNSAERKLINWILSEEGQKLAEGAGYVPMGVK